MKHIEIINAYKATENLAAQRIPLPVAYKLFKLREKLKKVYDFRVEEEQKLFQEFHPTFEEDGKLRFETVEEREQFDERMAALNEMEEDGIEPIDIPMTDSIELTTEEIQAITAVIHFTEPEK